MPNNSNDTQVFDARPVAPASDAVKSFFKNDKGEIQYTKVAAVTGAWVAGCAVTTVVGDTVVDLIADLL